MTLLLIIAYVLVSMFLAVIVDRDKVTDNAQELMYVIVFWPVFFCVAFVQYLGRNRR